MLEPGWFTTMGRNSKAPPHLEIIRYPTYPYLGRTPMAQEQSLVTSKYDGCCPAGQVFARQALRSASSCCLILSYAALSTAHPIKHMTNVERTVIRIVALLASLLSGSIPTGLTLNRNERPTRTFYVLWSIISTNRHRCYFPLHHADSIHLRGENFLPSKPVVV